MRRANPNGYWFLAKTYGYGWGMPATWQGWLVLLPLPLTVLLVALLPERWVPVVLPLVLAELALLVWACTSHGEPPRWRWGKRDNGPVEPVFPRPGRK